MVFTIINSSAIMAAVLFQPAAGLRAAQQPHEPLSAPVPDLDYVPDPTAHVPPECKKMSPAEIQNFATDLFNDFMEVKNVMLNNSDSSKAVIQSSRKKNIILFTDIGDDIDDFVAFGLLLNTMHIDPNSCEIKHVVTSGHGNHHQRAQIANKLIHRAAEENPKLQKIPISLGVMPQQKTNLKQAAWLEDYGQIGLAADQFHQPHVTDDAANSEDDDEQMTLWGDSAACEGLYNTVFDLVKRIEASGLDEDIVFLSIGPLHEVAAFIKKYPQFEQKVHFVGMQGSMDMGYYGKDQAVRENNVKIGVSACQQVTSSDWFVTKRLATLDACSIFQLDGHDFETVLTAAREDKAMANSYSQNIGLWSAQFLPTRAHLTELYKFDNTKPERSSILFDTVAALMALEDHDAEISMLQYETVDLLVTDSAHTVNMGALEGAGAAQINNYIDRHIAKDNNYSHEQMKEEWLQEITRHQRSQPVKVTMGWNNLHAGLSMVSKLIAYAPAAAVGRVGPHDQDAAEALLQQTKAIDELMNMDLHDN